MDEICKVTHKNKEILIINFSGCGSNKEKILNLIKNVNQVVPTFPLKSVLTLTNINGMVFNVEIINAFKESQKLIAPYQKKAAVIGVQGLQKIALDAVITITKDHLTKIFNTETEAKDWLVS